MCGEGRRWGGKEDPFLDCPGMYFGAKRGVVMDSARHLRWNIDSQALLDLGSSPSKLLCKAGPDRS